MFRRGSCIALAALGVACSGSPTSDEVCSAATPCALGSGTFKLCSSSDGMRCRYLTSDQLEFTCNVCNDCAAAATQAAQWCMGSTGDAGSHQDASVPGARDGGAGDAGQLPATTLIPSLRNPAGGGRPAEGAPVRVADVVVTGVKSSGLSHGFFVQDPNVGSWGGIFVFAGTGPVTVSPGSVVTVSGTFHVFRELDEIDASQGSTMQTGTHAVPVPLEVRVADINDAGGRAAELQSMLLRVSGVQVTAVTTGTDFTVANPADLTQTLVISSYIANDVGPSPFNAGVGQSYASITGHGYVTGAAAGPFSHKLAPRSPLDLVR